MTLDEVLEALLFRRSFRRRFARGERATLGIAPDDEADLATLDLDELERAARFACRAVLERSHRGVGSLLDAFPRSIEAWRSARDGADLDALATELTESAAFRGWTHGSSDGPPGPPLEEVFRAFCEDSLGPEVGVVARAECAVAVVRALVVDPCPTFAVPTFLRIAPRGIYDVVDRDGAVHLVAALDGRFVTGELTPSLAALLRADDPTAAAGGGESAHALRSLGLI